jgi:hypothetical protein
MKHPPWKLLRLPWRFRFFDCGAFALLRAADCLKERPKKTLFLRALEM